MLTRITTRNGLSLVWKFLPVISLLQYLTSTLRSVFLIGLDLARLDDSRYMNSHQTVANTIKQFRPYCMYEWRFQRIMNGETALSVQSSATFVRRDVTRRVWPNLEIARMMIMIDLAHSAFRTSYISSTLTAAESSKLLERAQRIEARWSTPK